MAALRNALAVRETLLYVENHIDSRSNGTVSLIPYRTFVLVENDKRKKWMMDHLSLSRLTHLTIPRYVAQVIRCIHASCKVYVNTVPTSSSPRVIA